MRRKSLTSSLRQPSSATRFCGRINAFRTTIAATRSDAKRRETPDQSPRVVRSPLPTPQPTSDADAISRPSPRFERPGPHSSGGE